MNSYYTISSLTKPNYHMTYSSMTILIQNNLTYVFSCIFFVAKLLILVFSIYVIWIMQIPLCNFNFSIIWVWCFPFSKMSKLPLSAYLLFAMHFYMPLWFWQRGRSILSRGVKVYFILTQREFNHSKYICTIIFYHLPWEICCHHQKRGECGTLFCRWYVFNKDIHFWW